MSEALFQVTGVPTRWGKGLKVGVVEKIHARHREHGVDPCLSVVEVAARRLMASEEFKRFARVDTLFGPKNFLKYLDEVALAAGPTRGASAGKRSNYESQEFRPRWNCICGSSVKHSREVCPDCGVGRRDAATGGENG